MSISKAKPSRTAPRKRSAKAAPEQKTFKSSTEPRVHSDDVTLVEGKSKIPKKAVSRLFWHIHLRGTTVGRAFIDVVQSETGEPDPSITVELNEKSRGRGIGSIAFRKACEASNLPEVYASIAKKNIASQTAVARAGFVPHSEEVHGGLTMVWRRLKQ